MVRIGLVQMRCEKDAFAANLEVISDYIKQAATLSVDILAFPEMSLTGYANPSKYPKAVLALDAPEVEQLLEATEGYSGTVLVGIIEANPVGKPFITQLVLRDGVLQGYYRKVTIKDDETQWFAPGQALPVFEHGAVNFTIAICADLTNREVFAKGALQGARIIFELAAPGLYGPQETRNWQSGFNWWSRECSKYLSRYAKEFGVWIPVATQAGRTVDEDFPGGGFVFAPNGELALATSNWAEGAVFFDLDLDTNSCEKVI